VGSSAKIADIALSRKGEWSRARRAIGWEGAGKRAVNRANEKRGECEA